MANLGVASQLYVPGSTSTVKIVDVCLNYDTLTYQSSEESADVCLEAEST